MTNLSEIELLSGQSVPNLGQGTWHMGESAGGRAQEVASLRRGLDLGMTLIDTAEMYASGGSERVVAEAISGRRDEVFVVSKVLPSNASRAGVRTACERSLSNLGIDRIDLYLLHWRGGIPLAETVSAFEELKSEGKIAGWGVSNFDVEDMEELFTVPGGDNVVANQVLYNLGARGIEYDLLPWCQDHGIAVMAYSPLDEGRLLHNRALAAFARSRGMTAAQVALAFVMARKGTITIPKTASPERAEENLKAAALPLSPDDLRELNALFPPPDSKTSLAMI